MARLFPALEPEQESPFADEAARGSCRRLLALSALVLPGHALHVFLFHSSAAQRASMAAPVLQWRDAVATVHAITFAVTLGLAIAILRWGKTRAARVLAPAAALEYVLHGAAIAAVDQLPGSGNNGVAPFIGYCLFMSVVVTLTPRVSVALYALAGLAFWEALRVSQPSEAIRFALLPNGISICLVSLTLSLLFYGARRRDFGQRATIERQRTSLSTLNAELEKRVERQVSEIVRRAEEVERLNAQLQAQVRARSSELSLALSRLASRSEADGSLKPGVVLGDRFEVGELLGQGGMGVVYAGTDRSTGARVAIKAVQATSARQLDALHRFLREARATAGVSHPAIVRALHVDVTEDGMLFQVLELVDGITLQRHMDKGGPLDVGLAARIVSTLAGALAAAHEAGIVHRDVKPGNVMLTTTSPGLKLLDFGIAKLYEDAHGDTNESTRQGVVLGTPAFMAPEQVAGVRDLTAAVDVYAAGLIFFLLLTGKHPYPERKLHGLAVADLDDEPPDVRTPILGADTTRLHQITAAMAELVSRTLKKDCAARPTARMLGAELAAMADALGTPSLDEAMRELAESEVRSRADLPETVASGRAPPTP